MPEPSLRLYTSNRLEALAERLLQAAASEPPSAFFAGETVVVQNAGAARWLDFRIADRLGVAFNWSYPFPAAFFRRVLAALDPDHERAGAFDEFAAAWILAELLDDIEDRPPFRTVFAYCRQGDAIRRLQLASRLARLYDAYLLYRPQLVLDWEAQERPEHWQGRLWKRLLPKLFANTEEPPHIARLWRRLAQALADGRPVDFDRGALPERVAFFGISAMPPLRVDLLACLARVVPIRLFLLQPTDLYWGDLQTDRQALRTARRRGAAAQPPPADAPGPHDAGNPLLPSWGRQSQAFLDKLIDADPQHDDAAFAPPEPRSQLEALHDDLFALRDRSRQSPDGPGSADASPELPSPFPGFDGSLEFHLCHSPTRECEALRDYLIARFHRDPALEPGDILVLAPDIEAYEGPIEAVFGRPEAPERQLPYSIADQSSPAASPLASAWLALLEMPRTRLAAQDLLQWLGNDAVRAKWRLSDRDLARIEHWLRELGMTWGLDGDFRRSRGAFPDDLRSWKGFRQRLAAALALGGDGRAAFAGVYPLPALEGEAALLAGRLLECLHLLESWLRALQARRPVAEWAPLMTRYLDALLAEREGDPVSIEQLSNSAIEALPDSLKAVERDGLEAAYLVARQLERESPQSGYLNGLVTFCSLKPMRSIPAKVICLLGMGLEQFPRSQPSGSLDLMARQPLRGDRNPREEDKQIFLETVLSARQALFVSWQAFADAAGPAELPPSCVVAELLDYLDAALPSSEREKLRHRHRRQGYDEAYFRPDTNLYTYAKRHEQACLAARAGADPNSAPPADLSPAKPAGDLGEPAVALEELQSFAAHPQRHFLRERLGARLPAEAEPLPEDDALVADGLARYQRRERFAEALLRRENRPLAAPDSAWLEANGLLSPGRFGELEYLSETAKSNQLAEFLEALGFTGPLQTRKLSVPLESGRLVGSVPVWPAARAALNLYAGELDAPRLLRTWLLHLALSAAAAEDDAPPPQAVAIGLKDAANDRLAFEPTPRDEARDLLEGWLEAFRKSETEPCPLAPKPALDFVKSLSKPNADEASRRAAWSRLARNLEVPSRDPLWTGAHPYDPFVEACFGPAMSPDRVRACADLAQSLVQPMVACIKRVDTPVPAESR